MAFQDLATQIMILLMEKSDFLLAYAILNHRSQGNFISNGVLFQNLLGFLNAMVVTMSHTITGIHQSPFYQLFLLL